MPYTELEIKGGQTDRDAYKILPEDRWMLSMIVCICVRVCVCELCKNIRIKTCFYFYLLISDMLLVGFQTEFLITF